MALFSFFFLLFSFLFVWRLGLWRYGFVVFFSFVRDDVCCGFLFFFFLGSGSSLSGWCVVGGRRTAWSEDDLALEDEVWLGDTVGEVVVFDWRMLVCLGLGVFCFNL